MLFEAKRVHNDRTDNWGTKLSDKMVLARASALRKESKLELDNAQVEIEAIETEAKNYQSSYEQRLRSTRIPHQRGWYRRTDRRRRDS